LKQLRLMTVAWGIRANMIYDRQVAPPRSPQQQPVGGPDDANRGGRGNLISIKEERHDTFKLDAACAGGMWPEADYTWKTELNVA
jgi:hypothetical protein